MSEERLEGRRWQQLVLFTVAAAILLGLALIPIHARPPIFIALLAVLALITYRVDNLVLTVLLLAYALRILFILIDHSLVVLPTPPIAGMHHERGAAVAAAWARGTFLGILEGPVRMRVIVAYVLAPFYVVFGDWAVAGRIAVSTMSIALGGVVFALGRDLWNRRVGRLSMSIVLFWPSIFYRSIVIQREILIALCMLTIVWVAVRSTRDIVLTEFFLGMVALCVLYFLRIENVALIAAVAGSVVVLKGRFRPRWLIIGSIIVLPFSWFFVTNFEFFIGSGNAGLSVAMLDSFAHTRAVGNAAYLTEVHYESWLDIVFLAPIKIVYFLFTPFVWQISSPIELVVGMTAIGLLLLSVASRRGFARLSHQNVEPLLIVTVYLLAGITSYAIIEMNYGAAVRRRIQFVPILVILAVIGFENIRVRL